MKFCTSYFANVDNLPKSFIKLSIGESTPEGFNGFKLGDFKPKHEWKETDSINTCIEEYQKQVLDKINFKSLIRSLELFSKNYNLSPNPTFALLTNESPDKPNYREMVAEFFTKNEYKCKEYTK